MLSVSTAHVTKETAEWLNKQGEINATSHLTRVMSDLHIGSNGYGWVIYCHDDGLDEYPSDLVKIFEFARSHHSCDYVNIDSDGETHDAYLEKYEW